MSTPRQSALLLTLLLSVLASWAGETKQSSRYPNELPSLRLFESGPWRNLSPLQSTMADVRKIMGRPDEAKDIEHYFEPYPGDDKAVSPVLTYHVSKDWDLLVYFVKYCHPMKPRLAVELRDRLCSLDFIPRQKRPFGSVTFTQAFTRKETSGVDAAWDEYSDDRGLTYAVYTARPPYGGQRPGDLQRIMYGPSKGEYEAAPKRPD